MIKNWSNGATTIEWKVQQLNNADSWMLTGTFIYSFKYVYWLPTLGKMMFVVKDDKIGYNTLFTLIELSLRS